MARRAARKKKTKLADLADRHALYQESVQDVEAEIDFVEETFQELRGGPARVLREDFCGTANTSCEWIRRHEDNQAIGVDIDGEVLEWGRTHNLAALSAAQQARISLVEGDVLNARCQPCDVILAMNFSYYLFKTRDSLRSYFEVARDNLSEDGILFLDAYGGYDAYREMTEPRDCDGFTYVWDQHRYDPITGDMTCYIHFKFKDKSRLRRAFEYHWRLWSLPEIRELLEEAGFSQVEVYWEGTDEDTGEGDGVYEPAEHGDADPGWICYIVAQK